MIGCRSENIIYQQQFDENKSEYFRKYYQRFILQTTISAISTS